MFQLILLGFLPLLTVCTDVGTWDPRYARIFGVSKDDPEQYRSGSVSGGGSWVCGSRLVWGECIDGEVTCKCKDGSNPKFTIGCCYKFPKCGVPCHTESCNRYKRCATCKAKASDLNVCTTCIKGYQGGRCDQDINECATNNGDCEQSCTNSFGSYSCKCYAGFELNQDKHTCTRLACAPISSTSAVAVSPTEDWLYTSFATFKSTDTAFILDGPNMAECRLNKAVLHWDVPRSEVVDTCTKVPAVCRVRCPNTNDKISKTKCLQFGCCHSTNTANAPACYVNPVKSFIRYGGISPVAAEQKGFKTYTRYDVDTCIHYCHNEHRLRCKSFGILITGRNDTHGVEFTDCYMLSKSKNEMETEGKLVDNPKYDLYESVELVKSHTSDARSDKYISKQYVGCFKDYLVSPDLPHLVARSTTHMNVPTCISLCRAQSYKYAGMQNGADCYCGNEFYRKYGESQSCNVTCSGNNESKCGGVTDNSVYAVAWTDSYKGCYNDDETSQDLLLLAWGKDAGRSASECMDECAKRDYTYAGLQDGGACYCGNTFGHHGAADKLSCSSTCYGYSRQNCGGPTYNAVYKTKMVSSFDAPGPDPYRLYDLSGKLSGISTFLFTFYPNLQSILSKRLIIQSGSKVLTPDEDMCGKDCYKPCAGIYQETHVDNKGSDVTLRFFYINLSELDTYVGADAKRVFVHAQKVIIDSDINLRYALYLKAKTIIIDRSKAHSINVPSDAKHFKIDIESQKFVNAEADTLHQKLSMMCARLLLNTTDVDHENTAFSMLSDIAQTKSQNREMQGVAAIARNLIVEMVGLARNNIHFVPFYTKTHLKKILENYFEKITIYEEHLETLLDEHISTDKILESVERMHGIYSDTNIHEANSAFEAAMDAIDHSSATYHRFHKEYNESRNELEKARHNFQEGLEAKKNWEIGRFMINLISSIAESAMGTLGYDQKNPDASIDGINVNIKDMWGLMQELSATISQIDAFSEGADKVVGEVEVLDNEFDAIRFYDEVEMTVQLQVNIIKWQNLKNYGETLLLAKDIADVAGCSEYHKQLILMCNWGEALTRSMVEQAEVLREVMKRRTILDLRKEQHSQLDDHIKGFHADLYTREFLITEMVKQSYDTRFDLNEALLTFCQAYFYENMVECKTAYKPSFGGSLKDLLLKINLAMYDDLLVEVAPTSLEWYVTIEDTNKDPACSDALLCPINYLRNNHLFYFNVPTNHEDLRDMDICKVSEITITINGAMSTTDNKYLKLEIESSGDFQGRANSAVYNFMSRALTLTFEYDISDNHVTFHADLHRPYHNIIQHITPFTTWVVRVSDVHSKDIDLSNVTSVRIHFKGDGIDNEAWKQS